MTHRTGAKLAAVGGRLLAREYDNDIAGLSG
jgi:hypothetical protein